MTRLLIAFTLLCGPLAFAHEAREPALCEASLRPGFESWARISSVQGVIVDASKPHSQAYEIWVGLRDIPAVTAGHMEVEFDASKNLLKVQKIILTHKKKGLSRYLFAKALDMFPQTETVQGTLVLDNATAFAEALAQTGNRVSAFKATPFYKAFKKLGFSQIDLARTYVIKDDITGLEAIFLTLQKPDANTSRAEELAKPAPILRSAAPPKPPMY